MNHPPCTCRLHQTLSESPEVAKTLGLRVGVYVRATGGNGQEAQLEENVSFTPAVGDPIVDDDVPF